MTTQFPDATAPAVDRSTVIRYDPATRLGSSAVPSDLETSVQVMGALEGGRRSDAQ
jgi:hypothetical protein